ncbi:hypothetical protein Tco_1525047 [Tanacetum coccineum]
MTDDASRRTMIIEAEVEGYSYGGSICGRWVICGGQCSYTASRTFEKVKAGLRKLEMIWYKCFLDAYKGFHQSKWQRGDEEKEAFYTEHGTFEQILRRRIAISDLQSLKLWKEMQKSSAGKLASLIVYWPKSADRASLSSTHWKKHNDEISTITMDQPDADRGVSADEGTNHFASYRWTPPYPEETL